MCLDSSYNSLEMLDVLSMPITLKFRDNRKFQTPCGGCLTVSLIFTFIGLTIAFIFPFLQRDTPRLFFQNPRSLSPGTISLENLNFFFAYEFKIYSKNTGSEVYDFYDYFSLSLSFVSRVVNQEPYAQTLNTTKCNETQLPASLNFSYYSNIYGMSKANCVDMTNVTLSGSEPAPQRSYISLSLFQTTENETDFYNWADNHELKFFVYFTDSSLMIKDYLNPISNYITYNYLIIDPTQYTASRLEMAQATITTDYAYFVENNTETVETLVFQTMTNEVQYRNSLLVFNLGLYNSENSFFYSRYYEKIPELLANIFSIGNVVMAITRFLNEYIKLFAFNVRMFDRVFEFGERTEGKMRRRHSGNKLKKNFNNNNEQDPIKLADNNSDLASFSGGSTTRLANKTKWKSKRTSISMSSNIELPNASQLSNLPDNNNSNNLNNKNGKDYTINRKLKSRNMFFDWKYSFIHLFGCLFCKKMSNFPKEHALYSKAEKMLNRYINLEYMVRRQMEVDFLKYFLLDSDEGNLVRFVKAPLITENTQSQNQDDFCFSNASDFLCKSGMKNKEEFNHISSEILNKTYESYNVLLERSASGKSNTRDLKMLDSVRDNIESIFNKA